VPFQLFAPSWFPCKFVSLSLWRSKLERH
jgi:hypothetical protein